MALYNRKLTPEVQKIIVKCLENGLSIAGACGKAKINKQTFYNWYNAGAEAKSGKKKEFHDAVDNAKDTAQANFESVIATASTKNWQAAAWWLERRRPKMYRKKEYKELEFEGTVKEDVTVNLLDRVKQKRSELNDIRSNRK